MAPAEFEKGRKALLDRNPEIALGHFTAAEQQGFDADRCAGERWYCHMLRGDFDGAWRESDAITGRGAPDPNRLWNGVPFDGKAVIVRCLHGYGDAIQFLRYAPLVRQRARRVIVETHPEMLSLVRLFNGVDEAITWGDGTLPKFTEWDQQIEVMDLPRAFRTTLASVPSDVPYLRVAPEAARRSAANLRRPGAFRVGILWQSSQWNPARSVPFGLFRRIAHVPSVAFYSFQRGAARAELAGAGVAITDTAEFSPDIADTAADLTNIDLLITVDTMAAHLAGALGRPVWTLLPWDSDWRWMLDRTNSPWYPTMRLFRQPGPGDWNSVIDQVIAELELAVRQNASAPASATA